MMDENLRDFQCNLRYTKTLLLLSYFMDNFETNGIFIKNLATAIQKNFFLKI
jgi:hypothetical protein